VLRAARGGGRVGVKEGARMVEDGLEWWGGDSEVRLLGILPRPR